MTELFEYGYLGLFLASFLAATVLPFSSEALLGLMIAGKYNFTLCILIASVGNWLGGMTSYFLGYLGKWQWIEKYMRVKREKVEKMKIHADKYGSYFALLCWAPVIGDPIAIALGLFKSNIYKVSLFMFIGKLLRYLVIGYFVYLVSG